MINPDVSRQELAVELPILLARAARAGWDAKWDEENLVLRVQLTQGKSGLPFVLRGRFDGYKAIPPEWEFVDPVTGEEGTAAAYPEPPATTPGYGSHVFIAAGRRGRVICLPCNRLAYGDNAGPHGDWSLVNWTNLNPRYLTVCEMVNRINTELQASKRPWGLRKEVTS